MFPKFPKFFLNFPKFIHYFFDICINLKPAIYTIHKQDKQGTKPFFRRTIYFSQKQGEHAAIHCSLFNVNFHSNMVTTGSTNEFLFFDEKLLCVCQRDCYLDANPANRVWQKTCLRNVANTYYTLFTVRPYFVLITNSV